MKKSIINTVYHACRIRNIYAYFVPLFFFFMMSNSLIAQTPDSWGNGQCAVPCNDQINVSLDSDGLALIDPILIWEEGGSHACIQYLDSIKTHIEGAGIYELTVDGIYTSSAVVNCDFVGQNVVATMTKYYNDGTVNSCWGHVLIEDKLAPVISCEEERVFCTADTSPESIGYPTATDNCDDDLDLVYTDVVEDLECNTFISDTFLATAKITRTWTAVDDYGNIASCTQTIYLQKATILDVIIPENVSLGCGDDPYDLAVTGVPNVEGESLSNNSVCELAASYEDTVVPLCEGSFKVMRRWTIVDWCDYDIYDGNPNIHNGVLVHVQVIELLDTTAPEITCPAQIYLSTNTSSCTASTVLPAADVTDGCSAVSVVTITPSGTIEGNGGTVYDLPLGESEIIYVATDACGNTAECSLWVNVRDDIVPVAICDEHTTISLGADGAASVCYTTFDDGSYDNCELTDYAVRRMDAEAGTGFAECVHFDCSDIGTPVQVVLRVRDAKGNENTCMVEVNVEDKLDPVLVCPADKTLECTSDYTNMGLTGEVIVDDNCETVTVDFSDVANVNQCGEGTVVRTWTAVDAGGRTASCTQQITLINSNPFTEGGIVWPADYDATGCGANVDADNIPAPYNEPVIAEGYCDLVAVSHSDELLPVSGDACFKVLRTWIVIDWCQYDPNDAAPVGRFQHVQIIRVENTVAPVIQSACEDVSFCSYSDDCGVGFAELTITATDDCSDAADLNYAYHIDVDSDGSINIHGDGAYATGEYPMGVHTITWDVEDGCGNITSCSYVFTISDCKKPSPVCINGLAAELMPDVGMISLWASDFVSGSSFDNCTAFENLQFSFSADVNDTSIDFTCANMGQQYIEIWATDEAGNQDFCATYVIIQDNMGGCPQSELAVIGAIQIESGENVEDVTVGISANNAFPTFHTTDATGSFAFPELPMGASVNITAEKDINYGNGLTTYDLVLIGKHILGLERLDSPYKIIAADANRSETITTFDLVMLRRIILNVDEELNENTSWRFIDKNYVFDNPNDPLEEAFPEALNYTNLQTDMMTAGFVAVKVGDVNGSATPNSLLGTSDRHSDKELLFNVDDINMKANETYTVAFKAKDFNEVIGYQFTVAFEDAYLEFGEITTGKLAKMDKGNFGLSKLDEGIITTSWNSSKEESLKDGELVFNLTFTALADAQLSEVLKINSQYTIAEAYQADEIANVGLAFNRDNVVTLVSGNEFALYQNQPNPVEDATEITFSLPKAGTATVSFFDVSGKILNVIEDNFAQGMNTIQISKDMLGNGMIYYRLDTDTDSATKKMIILE